MVDTHCPICGVEKVKETILTVPVPKPFFSSTTYICEECGAIWITGQYVIKPHIS